MRPHRDMQKLICVAAKALAPALSTALVAFEGEADIDGLVATTTTIEQALRARRGPKAAVYITWDTHGTCRYVGSVRRPRASAAVRERMVEHMLISERRHVDAHVIPGGCAHVIPQLVGPC